MCCLAASRCCFSVRSSAVLLRKFSRKIAVLSSVGKDYTSGAFLVIMLVLLPTIPQTPLNEKQEKYL